MKDLGKWLRSLPNSIKALIAGSIVVELVLYGLLGALAILSLSDYEGLRGSERAIITPQQVPYLDKILPSEPKTEEESPKEERVLVTRVIDGDTIEVEGGQRVRYIGIDCPEEGKPYSSEALAENKKLVEGRVVTLVKDISEKDDFGRLLRYVYVGDVFVNARLIERGLAEATAYPPDTLYKDQFEELEKEAKNEGRGMWPPPEEFQSLQEKQVMVYVNEPGIEYHLGGCEKVDVNSKIVYLDEAKTRGYIPCELCNPPE